MELVARIELEVRRLGMTHRALACCEDLTAEGDGDPERKPGGRIHGPSAADPRGIGHAGAAQVSQGCLTGLANRGS